MTDGQHDDVLRLHQILRHALQLVVAEVKGHQISHLEQVGRYSRVSDVVMTGIQNL